MAFEWRSLEKPFWCLAPMEGVTDTVFRQMLVQIGKPEVMFTEFTNTNLILNGPVWAVDERLRFRDQERPLIAQIWGTDPECFFKAAKEIKSRGFDGIDINLGCPDKAVLKIGAGSALISDNLVNKEKVTQIVKATREGASGLPVSVKTRLGIKSVITENWIGFLLGLELDALTVHFRTVMDESRYPARWEEAELIVEMRNQIAKQTVLIGNGDVTNKRLGAEMIDKYKVDGIMVGRGVFEDVGIFSQRQINNTERLKLYIKHVDLWEKEWKGKGDFNTLKKFMKTYVHGFDGASEMRGKIANSKGAEELKKILVSGIE